MTWGMVAMAVGKGVEANNAGNANVTAMAQESVAQNEAGVKANIANSIRTGYRVGLLNMQRGLQKKNAVQYGFDVTAAGAKALGSATANQAASGTIGASVDAVVNDINMKLGESRAAQQVNFEIDAQSFDTNLTSLVQEATAAIAQPYRSNIPSAGDVGRSAVRAGVMSFAGSYMGSEMNLGLGSKTAGSSGGAGSMNGSGSVQGNSTYTYDI